MNKDINKDRNKDMNNKSTSTINTYTITITALMAATTAIMAQIAIPMPAGVPMTLQTFAVTLAGIILGPKLGAISMCVYVLMGAVGLPVFASFRGGLNMLIGPTGGFLLSFPLMALIIGLGVKYIKEKPILFWTFLVLGTIFNYVVGTAMFCLSTGSSVSAGLAACVIPFIPTTIIKAILGGILGMRLRTAVPKID